MAEREDDIGAGLEAHSGRAPDGPGFSQATLKYIQTGLDLSAHRISLILQRQFPIEGLDVAHHLHTVRQAVVDLPPSSLVQEPSGKIILTAPNGRPVYANRIVESIYHANPQLGIWDYAIALYPSRNREDANLHYPGFNMRFTNVVTHGELPLTSPEAKIMAVGYLTQVAKLQGVAAVRKLMGRAKLYGGVAGLEFLEQHRNSLLSQIFEVKRHQAVISEGLATIGKVADQAELDEPEVQLLLDLNFLKGRAFDSPEEFQRMLQPIVGLIAAGDWETAFQHRDFLLDYFILSFPVWRQKGYQTTSGVQSYESMAQIVQAVRKGELEFREEEVPPAYRPLFEDALQRKAVSAEYRHYRAIIQQSLDLSNAILLRLGNYRGDYIMLSSPSGQSARELSKVHLVGNRQVCEVFGAESSKPVNFGAILYTRINHGLQYDQQHPDSTSDAKIIATAIQTAYDKNKGMNPSLRYSLEEYLMALFHSGKGRLGENDPVVRFIAETVVDRNFISP